MILIFVIIGYPLFEAYDRYFPKDVYVYDTISSDTPDPVYSSLLEPSPVPDAQEFIDVSTNEAQSTQNDALPEWYTDMFAMEKYTNLRWKLDKLLDKLPRLYSKVVKTYTKDSDAPLLMRSDDKLISHHI